MTTLCPKISDTPTDYSLYLSPSVAAP